MSGGSKVAMDAKSLVEPVLEGLGIELVDVEYKKEGSSWFLRFYIDKPGGIGIEDCQLVSRSIDALLDEKLDIPGHYYLEVSSPGLERPFKTDRDFRKNLGNEVEVSLFKPLDGKKMYVGVLMEASDGSIVLDLPEGTRMNFLKEEMSRIRRTVRF